MKIPTQAITATENPALLNAGDVVAYGKTYIKLIRAPEYNAYHDRWYYPGYRWIKTTGKWSRNALYH